MNQNTDILTSLNPEQADAVTANNGPVLILAGAGSGKTRVLVHRIAWLIQQQQVAPHDILAVTFTNKAAKEMRVRIESLLPFSIAGMWVGTFHGLANRLLRAHYQQAKLPQTFQILDSADQLQMIKRICKDLELDPKKWPPKQFQWMISDHKERGLRARHVNPEGDYQLQKMHTVYQQYEETCQRAGVVDFSELLLKAHEVLLENPTILEHYQQRFKHILVDEFQDTNKIQYAWLQLLSSQHKGIFAVGDDDQSIYGWRGAEVENIRNFSNEFPNAQMVKLEQNYRSTSNILNAANALIENNAQRLGKKLWTDSGEGDRITLYGAFNEIDEAEYVIKQINRLARDGVRHDNVAILYRSNAQSRLFEEQLMRSNIDYKVYGGLRFFDRKEIKDALAYLRLIANPHDDAALTRIINRPTRGIGAKCITSVQARANAEGITLWQAIETLTKGTELTARTAYVLIKFTQLIESLQQQSTTLSLEDMVTNVVETVELHTLYEKEAPESAATRRENLIELGNAAAQVSSELDGEDPLSTFLAYTALESSEEDDETADRNCVQLMTLHSAKGLEFPVVFLTGMEEGLFPHSRSMDDPDQLEEERRLCYVGITRAMQQLFLTHAHVRRMFGEAKYSMRSQFIEEMPEELITDVSLPAKPKAAPISEPTSLFDEPDMEGMPFYLGQHVAHSKFGEGVVLNIDMQGVHPKVEINFNDVGNKLLNMEYAKLTPLE
ncbi:MAG: DNA helicase II [Methylococcales bacterium]|jgi:DNA helicase II / ATP-dependent DNA helicase PcrA|nr:DNA helicase II [Methylococcales bacterium]